MTEHIRIGDITPRIQYVGDGVETVFTYPFPIFTHTDIVVHVGRTLQKHAADYTVSGAGETSGGSIVCTTPPATGETVTLMRKIAVKRTSDFQESGEFRASVINDELDRIIAMVQENALANDRSVRLSDIDGTESMVLPSRIERAHSYLAFDGDGVPINAVKPGHYPASEFMGNLLGSINATKARITLGALSPDGDGSRLTGITTGGPSLGLNGIYRTNAKNTRASVTICDHLTPFTADTAENTLDRGTDHGFLDGDPVYLTTTGSLPTGLSAGTQYYVTDIGAESMKLSATFGGPVIDITDTGAGTHTVYEAINAWTAGPNTIESGVTVTVPDGSTLTIAGG